MGALHCQVFAMEKDYIAGFAQLHVDADIAREALIFRQDLQIDGVMGGVTVSGNCPLGKSAAHTPADMKTKPHKILRPTRAIHHSCP